MSALTLTLSLLAVFFAMVGAGASWTFVFMYRRSPWRNYEAGRHLMWFTAGLGVILTWSILGMGARLLWPVSELVEMFLIVFRILALGWLACMIVWRVSMLRSSQSTRHGATADDMSENDPIGQKQHWTD